MKINFVGSDITGLKFLSTNSLDLVASSSSVLLAVVIVVVFIIIMVIIVVIGSVIIVDILWGKKSLR